MNNTVMCENCAHKDVCKHRDEFTDIQKQFNNFKVWSSAIKGGRLVFRLKACHISKSPC